MMRISPNGRVQVYFYIYLQEVHKGVLLCITKLIRSQEALTFKDASQSSGK